MDYSLRREKLYNRVAELQGSPVLIYLQGDVHRPRTPGTDVMADFRQNPTFEYYTGCSLPGSAMMLTPDKKYILFVKEHNTVHQVFSGADYCKDELKKIFGADEVLALAPENINKIKSMYQNAVEYALPSWGLTTGQKYGNLRAAVIEQRLKKDSAEIEALEYAISVTAAALESAMHATRPANWYAKYRPVEINSKNLQDSFNPRELSELILERPTENLMLLPDLREGDIRRVIMQSYISHWRVEEDITWAFPSIVTQKGYILHAEKDAVIPEKGNSGLVDGRMLLVDMGAECILDGDITRCWPINGEFSKKQKEIYSVVLEANKKGIESVKPGMTRRNIDHIIGEVITEGLIDLGIMQGDKNKITELEAWRFFMPHMHGHHLGRDCHDMREFDYRFPELWEGNVITIEPGIYFNPMLLKHPELLRDILPMRPKRANFNPELKQMHDDNPALINEYFQYINFERAWEYVFEVGGIRIEDDILVTEDGHRNLSGYIPKEIEDIERVVIDKVQFST